jgi:mono/diheme cytochrome c family protein
LAHRRKGGDKVNEERLAKTRSFVAIAISIFAAVLAFTFSLPRDLWADSRSVERGKKIFNSQICRDCHTMEGKGGKAAPDLTEEWKKGRTRDWIIQHLRNPHQFEHFTIMPDFHFSEEDEKALADYLLAPK